MPRGVYARKSLAERFWAKVERTDGCWLWGGAQFVNGYGGFKAGRRTGSTSLAHRVAWELSNGGIPSGLWVLHHCDTPLCVRPSHLFLGDHQANMNDMVAKGRSQQGERTHLSKLTAQQVAEIRARYADGVNRTSLAAEYAIDYSTVCYIIRRTTWSHLP